MAPIRVKTQPRKTQPRNPNLPIKCPTCGNGFRSQQDLAKHCRKLHSGERPACSQCDKTFSSKQALKEHIKHIHNDSKPSYSCNDCDKSYASQSALDHHVKTTHNDTKPSFSCDDCGNTYVSRSSLNEHIQRKHSDDKPLYTCDDCGIVYTTPGGLDFHLKRYHSGTTPYVVCSICNKSVIDLRDHTKTMHSETKPSFPCTTCDKVYSSGSALFLHIKTQHSETKPSFPCDSCEKSYAAKGALVAHIKHVHGDTKPSFPCDKCENVYTSRSGLSSHLRLTHADDGGEAYKEYLEVQRTKYHERQRDKFNNGICMATIGCKQKAIEPTAKCLYHLSVIKPWDDALKEAQDSSKTRKGYGSDIMDSIDMSAVLELGLSVPDKAYERFRLIRNSVLEPTNTDFIIDIEGSNKTCEAFEISVFRPDGTCVLTTIVDWESPVAELGDDTYLGRMNIRKIYGYSDRTFGMKRIDIATKLQESGMDADSTIFIWGSALDIRCLQGTIGEFMDLPDESVDCMQPWRSCLPGLPCHQLSVVHSVCFPDSDLPSKRHRAEPDTLMLVHLNELLANCAE